MQTLRFPYPRPIPNVGRSETSQIITLIDAQAGTLKIGGEQAYVDVSVWKTAGDRNTETPYNCVAIEFSGTGAGTLGNGTSELVGLFGQIDLIANPTTPSDRKRTLLAIIGTTIGNQMPQIPIVSQAGIGADLVGYTQLVGNIAAYDRLSIGGVLADVTIPESMLLTVVARPLRRRDYLG